MRLLEFKVPLDTRHIGHYSPDVGTGLLSPISYVVQCGILLRRKNSTHVVLKWFYALRAVGTTLSEVHALHRVISKF